MSGGHLVLIVEDDEDSREGLRDLLVLEGYKVETAANGVEALDRLDALGDRVCLMLLDLFMPVMNGWQVVDKLRADGRLSSVSVAVTTSAPQQAPPGLPVLAKPLDPKKVLDLLKARCPCS